MFFVKRHNQFYSKLSVDFSDHVSRLFGSIEEYDIFMWPRYLPDVWRQNVRMPHLSENGRKENFTVLESNFLLTLLIIKLYRMIHFYVGKFLDI